MSGLSAPYFHDEAAAFAELERTLWPNGPVCPRCGGTQRITPVKGGRIGLRRCGRCKRQFTVTVGTVFESSHVPLSKWLRAVHLMRSDEERINGQRLMRALGVQYKTARRMARRLREAMEAGDLPQIGDLAPERPAPGVVSFAAPPPRGGKPAACPRLAIWPRSARLPGSAPAPPTAARRRDMADDDYHVALRGSSA
jgi:transposase-like protein